MDDASVAGGAAELVPADAGLAAALPDDAELDDAELAAVSAG
jgi:hypothetical protein